MNLVNGYNCPMHVRTLEEPLVAVETIMLTNCMNIIEINDPFGH